MGLAVACIYVLNFTAPINQNVQNLSPEHDVAIVVVGLVLATNVLATTFIAWKAWDYYRTVGRYFRKRRSSGRVERFLVLLIESGFVYCILWVITFCPLSMAQNITLMACAAYLLIMFGILRVCGQDSILARSPSL